MYQIFFSLSVMLSLVFSQVWLSLIWDRFSPEFCSIFEISFTAEFTIRFIKEILPVKKWSVAI